MSQLLTAATTASAETGPGGEPVVLVRPLPGFPAAREFVLCALPDRYWPFARLACLDAGGPEFLVVPPGLVFCDYVVEISADDAGLLGVQRPEEVRVLVLVTRRRGQPPTANLMGPLVLNADDGRALQLVLQDSRYGVAVPLEPGTASARCSVAAAARGPSSPAAGAA